MIDHVIVTVKHKDYAKDMELPIKISVEVLQQRLLDVLKESRPELFLSKNTLQLKFEGRLLQKDTTLEENYVWDGSIIEIL